MMSNESNATNIGCLLRAVYCMVKTESLLESRSSGPCDIIGKIRTVKSSNWPLLVSFMLACTVAIVTYNSPQLQARTMLYCATDNIHLPINLLGLIINHNQSCTSLGCILCESMPKMHQFRVFKNLHQEAKV